jgi:hypothetical protein
MKVDSTITEKNLSIASEYYRLFYDVKGKDKTYSGGSTGFIPFKITMTLDGISGFKIYQKLQINTGFLPDGYPTTSEFIITGINNKLKDNDWETDLTVILIPKFEEFDSIMTTDSYVYVKPYIPPVTTSLTSSNSPNAPTPTPIVGNKKMKELLNSIGYTEGFVYELALAIGTKEGYGHPGNIPTDQNNPGDILYSSEAKALDPGATSGRKGFAVFSTPQLGAKALIELFIKKWAKGNYPLTLISTPNANAKLSPADIAFLMASKQYQDLVDASVNIATPKDYWKRYGVPLSVQGIFGKNLNITLEQFIYIYGPPHENLTKFYLESLVLTIKKKYPEVTKDTIIFDYLDK